VLTWWLTSASWHRLTEDANRSQNKKIQRVRHRLRYLTSTSPACYWPGWPGWPVRPLWPGCPCGPADPVGPCNPVAPVGPLGPLAPCIPGSPTGPAFPSGPCRPCLPVNPDGPENPVAPVNPAVPFCPCWPVSPACPGNPCWPLGPRGPAWPTTSSSCYYNSNQSVSFLTLKNCVQYYVVRLHHNAAITCILRGRLVVNGISIIITVFAI